MMNTNVENLHQNMTNYYNERVVILTNEEDRHSLRFGVGLIFLQSYVKMVFNEMKGQTTESGQIAAVASIEIINKITSGMEDLAGENPNKHPEALAEILRNTQSSFAALIYPTEIKIPFVENMYSDLNTIAEFITNN